jgi:hypothetical protein
MALGTIGVFVFSSCAVFSPSMAYPSPILMREIAGIGATILLGYVIEAVWLAQGLARDHEYEFLLGALTGLAVAGLIGVGAALLVAEHRAAHHGNLLDDIGLWWSVYSIGFLGAMVTIQPLMAAERAADDR